MPLPSGSALLRRQSTGGEPSFGTGGTPGISQGAGTARTPHSVRTGSRRPSVSGGRPSMSADRGTPFPSPLNPGWRGDMGQFQGQRGRLQDRRRSFSVPLSPASQVLQPFRLEATASQSLTVSYSASSSRYTAH